MKSWSVQDAKSRFSELLDSCIKDGPMIVTRRGVEAAVLLPIGDWKRLQQSARPTLKELLLAPTPNAEIPLPVRGQSRRRQPVRLD